MSKARAVVLFSNPDYLRNYSASGVVDIIAKESDVHILCDEAIVEIARQMYPGHKVTGYRRNRRLEKVFGVLSLQKTKELKRLVPGFRLRLERMQPSQLYLATHGFKQLIKHWVKTTSDGLTVKAVVKLSGKRFWKRLVESCGLCQMLHKLGPTHIFIPCQAVNYEVFTSALYRDFKDTAAIDICLVDNWDNLCSKSVFLRPPRYVGVYGEQSCRFGARIHGLLESNMFIWGSPRYDVYQRTKERASVLGETERYILYAGTHLFYDELADIKEWGDALNDLGRSGNTIRYLPHPARNVPVKYEDISRRGMSNVETIVRDRQDQLGQLADLVNKASFVICGPTSLVLESLICKKKVIVIARSDLSSYQSPAEVFSTYEHFHGIENNPLVRVFSERADRLEYIEWAHEKPKQKALEESEIKLRYYIDTTVDRQKIIWSLLR